jgi:3-methyladenine DNA glycosylase AlkD
MNRIIEELRSDLVRYSDPEHRKTGERFFREEVRIYGVKGPVIHKLTASHFKNMPDHGKETVFGICEMLFESGMMEEAVIACLWSDKVQKQFMISDFDVFDRWVNRYVTNWAVCDTLCNHSVGNLIMKYPVLTGKLKEWARSVNRWVRRASAVSLIIPARRGMFLKEIFEIAEIVLTDGDDMVQKGYGWMLKEASKAHRTEVYDFVLRNRQTMPRTALRYAIEKMPGEMRTEAMKK